jgi:hypothetical protein
MSSMTPTWPPTDPTLAREASNVVGELELDERLQRASQGENYIIPYALLGRLLAIGLPVVPSELYEFLQKALEFSELLPPPIARTLELLLSPDMREDADRLDVGAAYRLFWETRWQSFGCPAVHVDARLAASLMVTETPVELLEDLPSPWPCFVIRLPSDLVTCDGEAYTHAVVHRFERAGLPDDWCPDTLPEDMRPVSEKIRRFASEQAGVKWGIYTMVGTEGRWQEEARLAELLGRQDRVHLVEPAFAHEGPQGRVIEVVARLAAGICQMAETPGSLRRKSTKKARQHWRLSKAPRTTEYVLAPDVKITFDATDAVRSYVQSDRRKLPTLQWIVRGHWRNQVCGPAGADRKRIWTQPYWKGPDDSPRLFREYTLGSPTAKPR